MSEPVVSETDAERRARLDDALQIVLAWLTTGPGRGRAPREVVRAAMELKQEGA
jgi:hypothetical protein